MKWTNRRELLAAGLMMLLGILTAAGGFMYRVGSLQHSGPGLFPVLLGFGLIIISALIVASPSVSDEEEDSPSKPEWRAWLFVLAGVVSFIVVGKYGGLMPATFTLVLLAALGDKGNSPKTALLLAVGMTVAAVLMSLILEQRSFPLLTWI